MSRIEQAVFTSARTDRGHGYHVVAASPGVHLADQRELSMWGPSHDSLLESGADAVSYNFFPLPSGEFCISHTVPSGWEYSGRGTQIYTHCLVVPPETLRRFANHPLALAQAAEAAGLFDIPDELPTALETVDLAGGANAVHPTRFVQLLQQVGAKRLAILVQTVLNSAGTVAASDWVPAQRLFAGLFDCLPVPLRPAISFSTGLRYSSRRPFRVLSLPQDPAARRWLVHQSNAILLDLSACDPRGNVLVDDRARRIEQILSVADVGRIAEALGEFVTGPSADSDRCGDSTPGIGGGENRFREPTIEPDCAVCGNDSQRE
jgi:hypothetical protein